MKSFLATSSAFILFLFISASSAFAHCEIPCGIYDDAMRIKMLNEHIATIEKSMAQISEIEQADHHDSNQLVRWVMNKEDHANMFQEIVTQYFMTQRIKTGEKNYDQKLTLLHQMLLAAMKSKQTTELAHVAELRKLVTEFETLYFAPHD
jgi:nickel superoxide dismutase